jgi:hypothetical protein
LAPSQARLLGLLAVLLVVASLAIFPKLGQRALSGDTVNTSTLDYTPRAIPQLALKTPGSGSEAVDAFERNPFTFGAPPTPTRNLTPPPTRHVAIRPTPAPTPTWDPSRPTPTPPPPRFTRTYLGYFGPARLRVAAFRQDGRIEVATTGDILDDVFIIREIGLETVEIGFVGYPEKEVTRVPIAEN